MESGSLVSLLLSLQSQNALKNDFSRVQGKEGLKKIGIFGDGIKSAFSILLLLCLAPFWWWPRIPASPSSFSNGPREEEAKNSSSINHDRGGEKMTGF